MDTRGFSACHTRHTKNTTITTQHNTTHLNTTQHNTTQHNTTQQHDHNTTRRQRQRQTETDRDRERRQGQREKRRRKRRDKTREEKTKEDKTGQEKREDSFSVWWCMAVFCWCSDFLVNPICARDLCLLNSVKYDSSLISFSAPWQVISFLISTNYLFYAVKVFSLFVMQIQFQFFRIILLCSYSLLLPELILHKYSVEG